MFKPMQMGCLYRRVGVAACDAAATTMALFVDKLDNLFLILNKHKAGDSIGNTLGSFDNRGDMTALI